MFKIKSQGSKDILDFIENNKVPFSKIYDEYEFYVQDIKEILNYFSNRYNKILDYVCKQNIMDLKSFVEVDENLPGLNFTFSKDFNSLTFNKYITFSSYIFGNIDLDKCVSIREWFEVENFLKEFTNDLMLFKHPLDSGKTIKKIEECPLQVPKNLKKYFKGLKWI